MIKLRGVLTGLVVMTAVCFAMTTSAHAAALTVGGGCTIDIAITSVNNGADQAGCTATGSYGSSDTITLPAGTITLAATPTTANASVSIIGAGAGQTIIDGANTYGGMSCQPIVPPVLSFGVSGITFQNMASSAISASSCSLTAQSIEVTGSSGDLISSAVAIAGNYTVTNLMQDIYLHDNSSVGSPFNIVANDGGGGNINNTTLRRVTTKNNAIGAGACMGLAASAGQNSDNNTVNLTIQNSTFEGSGLQTLGLCLISQNNLTNPNIVNVHLQNDTITGFASFNPSFSGSGILALAQAASGIATTNIDMENTLVVNNLDSSNALSNCAKSFGGAGGTETINIISLGHNASDDTCAGSLTGTGDIASSAGLVSTLGALAANGGSLTPTRALLAGSPAIDAGAVIGGLTTDQRGITRPQGAAYDIGAYELVSAASPSPTPSPAPTEASLTLPRVGAAMLAPVGLALMAFAGYLLIDYRRRKALLAREQVVKYTVISHIREVAMPQINRKKRKPLDGPQRWH